MGIRLHSKLGANPRMTTCDICGKAASIVLLGQANRVDTCAECGARVYGGINQYDSPCPKCGCKDRKATEEIPEHQNQLPITDRCSECAEKLKTKIALILVDGEPPKFKGQRMGPVCFADEEQFVKTFHGEAAEHALKCRAVFMPLEVWTQLGLPSPDECVKIVEEEGGAK